MRDNSSKRIAMKIPKMEPLTLPRGYPTAEAMKSWNQNEHNYNPDLWALDYETRRYLSGMTENDLRDRHASIIRNMDSYTEPYRDAVPINSYQSSWYWHRKEYQTRLEFILRGADPPLCEFAPAISNSGESEAEEIPNGNKFIFRYSKRKYMRQMIEQGQIRFSPAERYDNEKYNDARRDDELNKHAYIPSKNAKITDESGRTTNVIGDIRRTVSGPDYHLVCFSCVWNEKLFADFDADTCVKILDTNEFAKRIESAGKMTFPDWYFHDCPIQYFDPYEQDRHEPFDSAMSKDFRFAYQNEYRIIWARLDAPYVAGYKSIRIGPAHDLMKMYSADGEEISL